VKVCGCPWSSCLVLDEAARFLGGKRRPHGRLELPRTMTRWSAPIGLVVAGPLRGGAKRRGGAGARSILAAVFLSVSERSSWAEPGERITRGQVRTGNNLRFLCWENCPGVSVSVCCFKSLQARSLLWEWDFFCEASVLSLSLSLSEVTALFSPLKPRQLRSYSYYYLLYKANYF